ncbi:phospholipase A1-Ibeta2, chloroplastic-like [Punica granatum]|uniref:Fungal lipase-type domain-containing protein n=2 Tax=Punica granatum TaxID=22663 RepID=A0A218XUR0_PUNGR|nr:phospholipase A1-Ibeta2, chloroplastic-like [Punica granatum]OWM88339.1 hypothetical protein CDL15_Pgr003751 [Punica granatum]PKI38108.1 hypothetical protein CRG98_041473 [Punica granatum]
MAISMIPSQTLNMMSRSGSFKCRTMSPLNSLIRTNSITSRTISCTASTITTSTDSTRLHLANLEKLLQKPSPAPIAQPPQTPIKGSDKSSDRASFLEKRVGIGLLEGLNLARIWPGEGAAAAAAEEMSPRHLVRLQRLLSMTQEHSPRNHLGSRWREYHGSNDWAGMLDPLDENLRREVVKYGELVQAAYQGFHSDPAMPEMAPPERHMALPDRSYRVTKSLYATSSIGLPKWVDDVAPDLEWMTQRSSWIGYVAVCDDRREIQRMGRRDIVIALRGTATCLEWAENLRAQQVPIADNGDNDGNVQAGQLQPKVQTGFLSLYKTRGAYVSSLAESVVEEVKGLMEQYKGETLSITVTGHSLGAALALLVADELSTCAPDVPPVAVFSFGGPRVGNEAFADRVGAKNVKVLRIVNNQDLITRVPGPLLSGELEQKLRSTRVAEEYWDYSHVGTEMKVETKMSPYLKPDADIACCHDLEAYLHLVDGFSSSECPFRPNAKRSLLKLLHEQGSNMKRLYIRKAKTLTLNLETERQAMFMSSCLPSPS